MPKTSFDSIFSQPHQFLNYGNVVSYTSGKLAPHNKQVLDLIDIHKQALIENFAEDTVQAIVEKLEKVQEELNSENTNWSDVLKNLKEISQSFISLRREKKIPEDFNKYIDELSQKRILIETKDDVEEIKETLNQKPKKVNWFVKAVIGTSTFLLTTVAGLWLEREGYFDWLVGSSNQEKQRISGIENPSEKGVLGKIQEQITDKEVSTPGDKKKQDAAITEIEKLKETIADLKKEIAETSTKIEEEAKGSEEKQRKLIEELQKTQEKIEEQREEKSRLEDVVHEQIREIQRNDETLKKLKKQSEEKQPSEKVDTEVVDKPQEKQKIELSSNKNQTKKTSRYYGRSISSRLAREIRYSNNKNLRPSFSTKDKSKAAYQILDENGNEIAWIVPLFNPDGSDPNIVGIVERYEKSLTTRLAQGNKDQIASTLFPRDKGYSGSIATANPNDAHFYGSNVLVKSTNTDYNQILSGGINRISQRLKRGIKNFKWMQVIGYKGNDFTKHALLIDNIGNGYIFTINPKAEISYKKIKSNQIEQALKYVRNQVTYELPGVENVYSPFGY